MATAVNNNVKLKESITSASTVRPASRTASSGVHSPRAPARNAKAWPARPEAKRAGSSRRASPERAMRGPASAVPRAAARRAKEQQPAASPDRAGDEEQHDHQRDRPPAVDPGVRQDLGQRDRAEPQHEQGHAKGCL